MWHVMLGSDLVFDVEAAASAAYDQYRQEAALAAPAWLDLDDEARARWHRITVAGLEAYDPATFGVAMRGLRQFWNLVEPVARPYLSLLIKPGK